MFEAFERVFAGRDEEYMERSAAPSSPRACSCRPHSRRRRQKLPGFVLELEGHRSEVVADFRQYYGIDLPLGGRTGRPPARALLWEQLPKESRCARRMYPELKWSEETYMLWRIEHQLRSLAWGLSDKKHRPPQEPQPLKTPGQLAELKRHQRNALANRAEIDEILGLGGRDGD